MTVIDFFQNYFITPIQTDGGYNLINTVVYAIIALILLYSVYKILDKQKIEIDIKFFLAVLPFIVLGSFMRSLVDFNKLPYSFWTVSPGIYLVIAGIFLIVLALSIFLQKQTNIWYWQTNLISGSIILTGLLIYVAPLIRLHNLLFGGAVILLAITSSAILYFSFEKLKLNWTQGLSFIIFPAHMLDASSTFIAVDFLNAIEKHPLPVLVNTLANTAAIMYVLKLVVLIPVAYLLFKDIENKNMRNFFIVAIAVLGLAEGLRNLISILII